MGNVCGLNIFDELFKRYGDDLAKYIAIVKGQDALDGKIKQLKSKTSDEAGKVKQQAFKEIDEQESSLDQQFNQIKKSINDEVPGGLEGLEKLKGQPIQQTLGYNGVKDQFKTLKSTADGKFTEQENNVLKQIDETKQEQFKNLDEQKPSIPLYDQLPEKQKKQVLKKGQEKFGPEIKAKQDEIIKGLGDKLNPENYLGPFKDIVPAGSVQEKVNSAMDSFKTIQKGLSGGFSNPLGGIF